MLNNIRFFEEFLQRDLPKSDYLIINSAWLSIMGIRQNGDLDLMISSHLWKSKFSNFPHNLSFGLPGNSSHRIRVHPISGNNYLNYTDIESNDDAVFNNRVYICDFPFIFPKFYFQYVLKRFELNDSYVRSLPIWKKNFLVNPLFNKKKSKLNKDLHCIIALRSFFTNKLFEKQEFSNISYDQWGFDDTKLKSIFYTEI